MAARITQTAGASVELIEGGRGDFIVKVDDRVVWNKKIHGGFPDEVTLATSIAGN